VTGGFDRPELLDRVAADHGAPLTVVAGPAGIGRTALLTALAERLRERDRPVVSLRLAPLDRRMPLHAVAAVALRLAGLRGRTGPDLPVYGGPGEPARHAAALAGALRRLSDVVVLVDDAQWMDAWSLEVAGLALRQLAGSSVRCVCAVRTPAGATGAEGRAVLARLRADGLAHLVPLPPMSRPRVAALVAGDVRARPHPALLDAVVRASRGVPAAVRATVDGYRRAGVLRVAGGVAYLTDPGHPPEPSADAPLLDPLRALGSPAWPVAKAAAALHPLGAALPALAGAAAGLDRAEVDAALDTLRTHRVLRADRGGGWHFRVPVTAAALRSALGEYERRRLATLAVDALWRGAARCDDPHYLPEQLRVAGRLVDRSRAATQLLAAGAAAAAHRDPGSPRRPRAQASAVAPTRAAGWLRAAAALTDDPAERARALLELLLAAGRHGDYGGALRAAEELLAERRADLPASWLVEAELGYLVALRGVRDLAALDSIAAGTGELPGGVPPGPPARAAAADLLGSVAGPDSPLSAWAVPPEEAAAPPGVAWARMSRLARARAVAGDLAGAVRVVARQGYAVTDLTDPDRCLLAWLRGHWREALDLALTSIATDVVVAHPPAGGALYRAAAEILFGWGWPVRATALIEAGRAERLALPALTTSTAAEVMAALGGAAEAVQLVHAALRAGGQDPARPGVDELWLAHTELARARGERGAARLGVAETGRAAKEVGTDTRVLHHLLARVAADGDEAAARSAVRLARGLGQPFTLARTLERVVRWTGSRSSLLREVYELFGGLEALLHRHRVRILMNRHAVAVPARGETVTENERLLARLVAQGLSNRQLAAVLQTSEKGVESRLSRLFARTGYRSRVELAAAVLDGADPPG